MAQTLVIKHVFLAFYILSFVSTYYYSLDLSGSATAISTCAGLTTSPLCVYPGRSTAITVFGSESALMLDKSASCFRGSNSSPRESNCSKPSKDYSLRNFLWIALIPSSQPVSTSSNESDFNATVSWSITSTNRKTIRC